MLLEICYISFLFFIITKKRYQPIPGSYLFFVIIFFLVISYVRLWLYKLFYFHKYKKEEKKVRK